MTTQGRVVCLFEGSLGMENLFKQLVQMFEELVVVEGKIVHRHFLSGCTHLYDRRVGIGGGSMDIKQRGCYPHRLLSGEYRSVEERLEYIAGAIGIRSEELFNAFRTFGHSPRLIIDNAQYALFAVQSVYDTSYAEAELTVATRDGVILTDTLFHSFHAEGSIAQVVAKQLLEVEEHHTRVDELSAVVFGRLLLRNMEEELLEGSVHIALQFGLEVQEPVDVLRANDGVSGCEIEVEQFG